MFTIGWSPIILGLVILALIAYSTAVKRQRQPKLDFPSAEIDESDWHGSLMRAKTKVCYALPQSLKT